jgi:hypothetical protein
MVSEEFHLSVLECCKHHLIGFLNLLVMMTMSKEEKNGTLKKQKILFKAFSKEVKMH